MNDFKIFDGTSWLDPCTCNIRILDEAGNFIKIDPVNCDVKYFDGTNWCSIICLEVLAV